MAQPAQSQAAPVDERAMKHHSFFHKLYAPAPADGEDICFGTGYKSPKVPIVLQTIPEGRDAYAWFSSSGFKENGDEDECRRRAMLSLVDGYITENLEVSKYTKHWTCRIDGMVFTTQATAVAHIHDAHKSRIEALLFDLLQDMEQNHMGCFFTKLLYSDFLFPSPIFNSKELSSEFPSVLAPDLERLENKNKTGANGKAGSEKKKSKTNGAGGLTAAAFGFTEEELQQMERRLFSGRFLVDASTEAKLSAKTPADKKTKSDPAAAANSAATAAAAAATEAAKAAAAATEKANKKKEAKEAKEAAAREAALKESKEQAAREVAREKAEKQAAAERAAKEKAEKEKAEKEKERQRREAERKAAEKERQEKERAAKAIADAAEKERIRLESTAEFKKVKKQMEDELMADLFEEVVSDFMTKLAARTLQEQRREEEKAKQEAADKAAAAAEAQQEQDLSAKEKRSTEKKILRDLKKLEGDRIIDDVIDELVLEESLVLVPEVFQDVRREALQAAVPAAANSRRASAAHSANSASASASSGGVPSLSAISAAAASWSGHVPHHITPAPPSMVPTRGGGAARPASAFPTVMRSGKASAKAAAAAVPAYQPFPMAPHGSLLGASVDSAEGADELDEYMAHERLKLNLDTDEHLDLDDEQPSTVQASGSASIFGLFSSKLTEPAASGAAGSFTPSPRRTKAAVASASAAADVSSVQAGVELPPRLGGMSPPPPPLRSVPEDLGFDPQLCVTCYNLPSIVPVNRSEVMAFFRDCPIAVGPPDFSPKIGILRGAESGACYVQFESPAVVQKALTRDRQVLRDRQIRIVPAQGLRTSNSGQRFALNVQTRNASGQPQLGDVAQGPPLFRAATPVANAPALVLPAVSAPPESAVKVSAPGPMVERAASSEETSAFTGFALPLISDFRPAVPATSQHSLSSLLNTEQDAVIIPHDRKAGKSGAAIGAPGKAPGPPVKSPTPPTPAAHVPASTQSVLAQLEEDDTRNDETFASSFGGDGSFDHSGQFVSASSAPTAAHGSIFGTAMPATIQLPVPNAQAAYMRAASPPAPYRGVVPVPAINPRVVTPPPPGFHVQMGLPMHVPPGFVPPKQPLQYVGAPMGMPDANTRQPTVAPASSAEAAFMDRFL